MSKEVEVLKQLESLKPFFIGRTDDNREIDLRNQGYYLTNLIRVSKGALLGKLNIGESLDCDITDIVGVLELAEMFLPAEPLEILDDIYEHSKK